MIFIKELYPNPPGADTKEEWIKLWNDGLETIFLSGWKLKDASGKSYILKNGIILGKNELILKREETNLVLGNTGDDIFLYDASENLVSSFSYTEAVREGAIISRNGDFYFAKDETLLESNLSETGAIISQIFPTSIWVTAIVIGLIFAFIAVFIGRRIMED